MMVGSWRRGRLALLCSFALLFPCLCGALVAQEEKPPRRFAVLVGCTEYPKLAEKHWLRGPENDVALMESTLRERLGFPAENIISLVGWPRERERRPTMRNIVGTLHRLSEMVGPGDIVFIQMSGHGTQQPDRDGDEPDGLDEVFLCADAARFDTAQGAIPNALTDDELGRRVAAIRDRGAFVWLVVDSCHSGTVVRGSHPDIRFRQIDRDELGVPAPDRRAGRQRSRAAHPGIDSLAGVVAFYAAQPFHKAPEMPLPPGRRDAKYHGLLTYLLAQQLSQAPPDATFQQLQALLLSRYPSMYSGTMPMVEGELARRIFDGLPDLGGSLLARRVEGRWVIGGGLLLELGEGTVLEVARPGRGADEPLGRLEVVEASWTESRCRPVSESDAAALDALEEPVLEARVVSRPLGDYRLKVAVMREDRVLLASELPESIARSFERCGETVPVVARLEEADWILEIDDGLVLRDTWRGGGVNRFVVQSEELAVRLRRIFRARNLRRFAAGGLAPRLPNGLAVRPQSRSGRGPWQDIRPGGTVIPGQDLRIEIRNETGMAIDLTILYLDAHHGLEPLFPKGGKSGRLLHVDRKPIPLGPWAFNDQQMGPEGLLVIAVPGEPGSPPRTFESLAQKPLRPQLRGQEHGFAGLLDELAFGTELRGVVAASRIDEYEPSLAYIGWTTRWPDVGPPPEWPAGTLSIEAKERQGDGRVTTSKAAVPKEAEASGDEVVVRGGEGSGGDAVAEEVDLVADPGEASPVESPALEWPPSVPGPGDLGPRIAWADSGSVLLSGGERPTVVYVDMDIDGPRPPALDELASGGTRFEAEAAFRFFVDRAIAYYDTDDDGRFDLILVDDDSDPAADIRYSLREDRWHEAEEVDGPWLWTMYLPFLPRGPRETRVHMARFSVLAARAE